MTKVTHSNVHILSYKSYSKCHGSWCFGNPRSWFPYLVNINWPKSPVAVIIWSQPQYLRCWSENRSYLNINPLRIKSADQVSLCNPSMKCTSLINTNYNINLMELTVISPKNAWRIANLAWLTLNNTYEISDVKIFYKQLIHWAYAKSFWDRSYMHPASSQL